MSSRAEQDLAAARRAVSDRHVDPARARSRALEVLDRVAPDSEASAVARLAVGLAARELGRLEDAETELRRSIEIANAAGLPSLAAEVRSALVAVVIARGRPADALVLAELARDGLPHDHLADLEMKRGLALEQLGRLSDAIEAYRTALSDFVAGSDPAFEARLRSNLAIALTYRGSTSEALDHLAAAEQLAADAEQFLLAGGIAGNAGFLHGRRGEVLPALDAFERAERAYARVDYPGRSLGVLASDRTEVLLLAGLAVDARQSAQTAVELLGAIDDVADLAEARLLLARANLAVGDAEGATAESRAAAQAFESTGRSGWRLVAEYVGVVAELDVGDVTEVEDVVGRSERIAADLDESGWEPEATEVRIGAARLALRAGMADRGRRCLELASGGRRSGAPDRRARAWHATALLHHARGDITAARRAITAGLRVVDDHRASLGATELRAGATGHAAELAALGVSLALDRGRPAEVFRWSERERASTLDRAHRRDADGDADEELARRLRRLRQVSARAREERLEGGGSALAAAVRRAERDVRAAAMRHGAGRRRDRPVSLADTRTALAGATLLEYVLHDGDVHVVVVRPRRTELTRLGQLGPLADEIDAARFFLQRLSSGAGSPASIELAARSLEETMGALGAALIEPVLEPRDERVVVVPTGDLHRVPWSAVPHLSARSVSVAPSASHFARRREATSRTAHGFIAGPELPAAIREVETLATRYRSDLVLTGDHATADATLQLFERASLLHLACHGHFRSDNPMFSSLQLADGPVTIFDLERLRTPPDLVVLPACDAASGSVRAGDEVIGAATALLRLGVREVVAPVCPVDDDATAEVMLTLHRHLAAGDAAPTALANARRAHDADRATRVAASAFICIV